MKLSIRGEVSHHFGEALNLPKKVSCNMGYRSDSIAVSRDMGHWGPWDKPGVVARTTGPKSTCLGAFFLPELSAGLAEITETTEMTIL